MGYALAILRLRQAVAKIRGDIESGAAIDEPARLRCSLKP